MKIYLNSLAILLAILLISLRTSIFELSSVLDFLLLFGGGAIIALFFYKAQNLKKKERVYHFSLTARIFLGFISASLSLVALILFSTAILMMWEGAPGYDQVGPIFAGLLFTGITGGGSYVLFDLCERKKRN